MKMRILVMLLITSLVGCASTQDAAEENTADGAETAEASNESTAEGDDAGLSDEPMGDGEATAATNGESERSLFDRIGGKGKLQMFADKFITALAANADLQKNPAIAAAMKADQSRHKQMLVDFLCANSGGPCTYGGRSMKEAHAAVKVTAADWNVMRKIFIRSLREMKVPKKERMDLALIAAKQKKHIVTQ